jgi:hypothetical protein
MSAARQDFPQQMAVFGVELVLGNQRQNASDDLSRIGLGQLQIAVVQLLISGQQ